MNPVQLVSCLLLLVAAPSFSQLTAVYRDRTGTRETAIRIRQDPLPHGFLFRSFMSDGEYHEVEYGPSDTTVRYRVQSPARGIDYSATREGNTMVFKGVFGGRPLARSQRIDDHPWLETVERSLIGLALDPGRPQTVFWIVQPWEAKAYLMQALNEGEDAVMLDGCSVGAVRVRVRPYGLLALFWSSLYWYRLPDGLFLRYEAVRGLPGTPLTVVELASED
jgi:hypothetical protein